jgi:hypothetical protein
MLGVACPGCRLLAGAVRGRSEVADEAFKPPAEETETLVDAHDGGYQAVNIGRFDQGGGPAAQLLRFPPLSAWRNTKAPSAWRGGQMVTRTPSRISTRMPSEAGVAGSARMK